MQPHEMSGKNLDMGHYLSANKMSVGLLDMWPALDDFSYVPQVSSYLQIYVFAKKPNEWLFPGFQSLLIYINEFHATKGKNVK